MGTDSLDEPGRTFTGQQAILAMYQKAVQKQDHVLMKKIEENGFTGSVTLTKKELDSLR